MVAETSDNSMYDFASHSVNENTHASSICFLHHSKRKTLQKVEGGFAVAVLRLKGYTPVHLTSGQQ